MCGNAVVPYPLLFTVHTQPTMFLYSLDVQHWYHLTAFTPIKISGLVWGYQITSQSCLYAVRCYSFIMPSQYNADCVLISACEGELTSAGSLLPNARRADAVQENPAQDIQFVDPKDAVYSYTHNATSVVQLAKEESHRMGHNVVGSEHTLLGLTTAANSVAARILSSMSVMLRLVRVEVEKIIGHATECLTSVEAIPFTVRAKRILELSFIEADRWSTLLHATMICSALMCSSMRTRFLRREAAA